MNNIFRFPITLILIIINVIIYIILYTKSPAKDGSLWTLHLLNSGAIFNPFTLNGEWYRIFTHMFLHGSLLHIGFNMYALYSVGQDVEQETGPLKFLVVYFICGVAAALTSLWWTLFSIGVGASGAIFGLFGFSLVSNLVRTRKSGHSITPLAVNFGLFLILNLVMAEALHADTSAHLGGLACGIVLGVLTAYGEAKKLKYEYAFLPILIAIYFALPRYQVQYYNFFQYIIAAEDSARNDFNKNASDAFFLQAFRKSEARWDSALALLNAHPYLPKELEEDTFKLRRYIQLMKKESHYRVTMLEYESYIYLDSIHLAADSASSFNQLDYPLVMKSAEDQPQLLDEQEPSLEPIRVLYNKDWEEIAAPPFTFYRLGTRDSLGRWQGRLQDHYANGDVQMKGSYKDDERHGIFIYYSDHKTYESAGRYYNDVSIGKWETFHRNGKLESEVYYTDRYFLKNLWDSAGYQLVKDGNGRVEEKYFNGVIANEGDYRNGYREGLWLGRHKNGALHYEENYFHGRLVNGRSRDLTGDTFIYDESSFFPLPVGGLKGLKEYLRQEVDKHHVNYSGVVRLNFRVTSQGSLTDFKILKSVSKEADELAKQILKEGPQWIPAKEHGHEIIDGFAYAEVEF